MRASIAFPVCLLFTLTHPARAASPAPLPGLTLDEAVAIARANHPHARAQRAQLEIVRARFEQARSGFLPGLTGSFAYNPQTANFNATPGFRRFTARPTQNGIDQVLDVSGTLINAQCIVDMGNCSPARPTPPPPISYEMFTYWTAGVGVAWTLFDWGRTYYAYRAASSNVEAQQLGVEAATAQVVLDVKLSFYGQLAAQAAVAVAEEALATQQRHAEQARTFYSVGARTKIDVASAESDVAAAELTLVRARGNLEAARAILAAALGLPSWRSYELVAPEEPADTPVPDEQPAFDEALRSRPEPRAIERQARAAENTWRSVRGAFLPQLVLNAGPTWAGTDITKLTPNISATLLLTFPVVGGMNPFAIAAQLHEARGNRELYRAQAAQAANEVRLETAQARAQVQSARQAVLSSRKLVLAARQRRDLAEGRYQAGVGSILELSDAQLVFINARFQEVQANLDEAEARARLERALGRTS